MNEFTTKPEIIFICYDEIIKNPYPFLLNQIRTKYKSVYKDFINMSLFENYDDMNLMRLVVQRTRKNILDYLSIIKFDYNGALDDLKDKFDDMYSQSPLLKMGESVNMMMTQKFTKQIYVYTEKYDPRVHLDLQMMYKNMSLVSYVTGDFKNVINTLEGVTTWILDDIFKVSQLVCFKKVEYTNILVANYGYNFSINKDKQTVLNVNVDDWSKEHIFKFGTFMPIQFTKDHFIDKK